MMKNFVEILIADRNPHIRDFLRRELAEIGYHVRSVENGKKLMELICSPDRVDLLVLDPDLSCLDTGEIARMISARSPELPVVLHCVRGTEELPGFSGGHVVHVEKSSFSAEVLKVIIHTILSPASPSDH